MPVRFLSDAQREQLSGFPAELEPEALDRFFTLSGPDLAEVRRRHGDQNRLGWSLQLCGLRMLGFCPDDVTTAPPSAVRFVARQLGVDPGVLDGYGSRAQTRTDHVNQVKAHLGFCSATNADLEDARDWLAAEALVQDRPVVLFRLVCERLHELRLVRPGLSVIEQSLVGAAREAARKETAARVAHLATPGRCRSLDGLLQVDPELGAARATWLRLAGGAGIAASHARRDGQGGFLAWPGCRGVGSRDTPGQASGGPGPLGRGWTYIGTGSHVKAVRVGQRGCPGVGGRGP